MDWCKKLTFNVVKSLVFVVCVAVFLVLMSDVWKKYTAKYEFYRPRPK